MICSKLEPGGVHKQALAIHLVNSDDSPELTLLQQALAHSSIIGLDAEWKPNHRASTFPTVSLLQIACRLVNSEGSHQDEWPVFLLDLNAVPFPSVYELLRQVFVSPDVIKLGFRFKQDLVYLSSTFCQRGCEPGFDRVEPYIDITAIYNYLQPKHLGRRILKQNKSLATICQEVLGIFLSKELQCSDWSQRPLSAEQKAYAAADAHCLLEIFNVFHAKAVREEFSHSWIVRKHGDKILLKDSDRKPKNSKKKALNLSAGLEHKQKTLDIVEDWQGPARWDPSIGGDGCPKFLCDVMVEGLARHLRCVGIDAAVPHSKKPGTRELIDQAQKERRVLLTRDTKILKHEYLIKNQIYRIKNLLKNDQLREVIETFQIKITENQLMSRCSKCNGSFIQKPLTTDEAVKAAKGFQVIPDCLFNKNLEFWQCMDCNQLYWEGTQYHNAVHKFMVVCKLNEEAGNGKISAIASR